MLKRFWLLSYFLYLLFAEKTINCMEISKTNTIERIAKTSLLEAQPLEILRNIVLAFFELNKNEHCIHSAQLIWNQTAGLRQSNRYFNQIIEELIVTYCSCELVKLSSEEKFQLLKNCNLKNQLGIILIILSTINPLDIWNSVEYQILKKSFREKIISYDYDVESYFKFNFQSGEPGEILKIIDILKNFIAQCNCLDFVELNKHYPAKRYLKKLGINSFNVIESAIRYIRKDLLKELVRSSHKEPKRINFEKNTNFLSILAYFYYKPNPVFLKGNLKNWISRKAPKTLYEHTQSYSPLDWAIILDEETVISLIYEIHPNLYGSDSQNPSDEKRAYSHILSNLNFAATFAEPSILQLILLYHQQNHIVFSTLDFEKFTNHFFYAYKYFTSINPLQRTFDYGNEDNFLVLANFGFDLSVLKLESTPQNQACEFFQKLIANKSDLTAIKNIIIAETDSRAYLNLKKRID